MRFGLVLFYKEVWSELLSKPERSCRIYSPRNSAISLYSKQVEVGRMALLQAAILVTDHLRFRFSQTGLSILSNSSDSEKQQCSQSREIGTKIRWMKHVFVAISHYKILSVKQHVYGSRYNRLGIAVMYSPWNDHGYLLILIHVITIQF